MINIITEDNGQENAEGQPAEAMPTSDKPAGQVEGSIISENERTKQEFEKLKAHNKELSEKLAHYEQHQPQYASVLDELRPSMNMEGSVPSQAQEVPNFVDENDYVDMALLQKTLAQQQEEIRKAQEEARLAREKAEKFELNEQVKKAHELFPQLDPHSSSFDERFYKLVKNEIIGQKMQGYENLVEAASRVNELINPTPAQPVIEPTGKQAEAISKREQANTATGIRHEIPQDVHENLDRGVQKGDSLAIGVLLQQNGY